MNRLNLLLKKKILLVLLTNFFVLSSFSQSVGGTTSGDTTYCSTLNAGSINLSGETGSILFWQLSTTGTAPWTNISNTTNNLAYFSINQTTHYRAVVQDGSFPTDTSTITIITINPAVVGGTTSGAAIYCAAQNSGFITLSGHVGTILSWESSTTGSAPWTNLPNPTSSQSYLNLTQTTHYRTIIEDCSLNKDTSTVSIITINPPAIGGSISGAGAFCVNSGTGTLTLSGYTSTVLNWLSSSNNGVTWTNINNTTATLNHPNITQNTLYAAVVENFSTCPSDTSVFASFVIDAATVTGTYNKKDSILCADFNGEIISLTSYVGSIIDWKVSIDNGVTWNGVGNTTDTLSFNNLNQNTWYQTTVKNGACNSDSTNILKYTVLNPNVVNAGLDDNITQFETIELQGAGIGTPLWSPSASLDNPAVFNPNAKPKFTTLYIITLTDSNQCVSSDSVLITVSVPFPNAITPNGDGANDFYIIDKVESLLNNTLSIFNRYGNLVFDESPYTNSFNGKSKSGGDLPDGIYYYTFDFGDGREVKSGYILIKR